MITVEDISVHYGDLQVLWDLSLEIRENDSVVAIVGPNGAGKTTLLKSMSGVLRPTSGSIELFGRDATTLSPSKIVEEGFVHVSEKRNLFNDLTVYENLKMGAYTERDQFRATFEEVIDMFPVLDERRDQKAGTLSGGEQQMLAIGRGLMAHPDILALDEPSGALAPQLAERVFAKIEEISENTTVILIEQHVDRALDLSDRAYLFENGRIATEGSGADLLESDHVKESYLSG
ncbi:ABC transporter ATP-binding protein [Haloarcula japonica]|uniref:ABC-type branched-chain amino acid transport system, ATPase component n=1 Tax=Haloarcula japonica (strain ATCC 49778 / DSM 6131 / JCM 7785 / NBRC 101032 / NCIMB 13157 / TR-1) TaxID=1227453 RepID=M0L3G1_HALJT|nr:ABC transporter ATP-binding protein [Haloarcula japonica]EMA26984.1 ABC-type branched-chain amino acid transport system, ATPase component [Haloarcula japonica DSM 6131]